MLKDMIEAVKEAESGADAKIKDVSKLAEGIVAKAETDAEEILSDGKAEAKKLCSELINAAEKKREEAVLTSKKEAEAMAEKIRSAAEGKQADIDGLVKKLLF